MKQISGVLLLLFASVRGALTQNPLAQLPHCAVSALLFRDPNQWNKSNESVSWLVCKQQSFNRPVRQLIRHVSVRIYHYRVKCQYALQRHVPSHSRSVSSQLFSLRMEFNLVPQQLRRTSLRQHVVLRFATRADSSLPSQILSLVFPVELWY